MPAAAVMPDRSATSQRFTDPLAHEGERTYALFNHLIGIASFADGMGLVGLIGSIIMWRIKAKESPFLDDHGREATNFQISLLVYLFGGGAVLGVLTAITLGLASPLLILGALFLFALRIFGSVRGAIAANRGEYYRYPMCIRFISAPTETA